MAFINITNNFEGVTTLDGLLQIPNTTTGGLAWIGLLIMMQVIIFTALLPFGMIAAIMSSAFIALVAGIFLMYMGVVSWFHLAFFVAQILFMIAYITWQQRTTEQ